MLSITDRKKSWGAACMRAIYWEITALSSKNEAPAPSIEYLLY
jgi:hypothetical protein